MIAIRVRQAALAALIVLPGLAQAADKKSANAPVAARTDKGHDTPSKGHHQAGVHVPSGPPAAPKLPPAPPVPVRPVKPPPPPIILPNAQGVVTPISGGVSLSFGGDSSALNPATAAALHEFSRQVKPNEAITVTIEAFASGSLENPSTARRLSLSRALQVRSILVADGIAPFRITVRAMGAAPSGQKSPATAPDRADVLAYLPVTDRH